MKKNEIFAHIMKLEHQIGQLCDDIGQFKEHVAKLMEENHALIVENDHLRQRLEKEIVRESKHHFVKGEASDINATKKEQNNKEPVGEGYDNLARLYQEGFHICNLHYGSIRHEGDCLFCLSFLKK